ncbi:hypothetical protein CH373_07975 [Leptospira perolatii]|uniref:histidine kinase n=1 Tax=Leptospira perolatii TaxID=2023191 RepID=A0A2M9ZMY7_9LEPT|nr:PAS domain-containing protein [Leptospira perolatii]PJZ68936.1 hypothetical protein CH360_13740 [Leptospira perolatii]PJZ73446.1 hypothetical protein CH373_07975 [Leptospira perolatii]
MNFGSKQSSPNNHPEDELRKAKNRILELEEQLKTQGSQSEAGYLRVLLDYAPDALCIVNPATGIFTEVNKPAEQLFGLSRQELLRIGPAQLSPPFQPDGRPSPESAIEKIMQAVHGETPTFFWEHLHSSGESRPCEIQLVLIPGNPPLVRGNLKDLRSKIEAEKEIQRSQERFNLVIEGADLGLWDWDIISNKYFPNERWASLLGLTLAEVEKNFEFWKSRVHPDDLAHTLKLLNEHLEGISEIFDTDFRMLCKDGSWKWIRSRGKVIEKDSNGKPLRALGIHLDISEAKEAEQQLRDNKESLNLAIQSAKLGLWDWSVATKQYTVDENWLLMLGYRTGEVKLTYEFWVKSLHPDDRDRVVKAWSDYLSGRSDQFEATFRLRCKDDSYKWLITRGTIVEWTMRGQPKRMIGLHIDISEQKKIEEELRETKLFLDRAQKIAKIGSWEYDLTTKKVTLSDVLKEILETETDTFPYQIEKVHRADREKVENYFRKSLETGVAEDLEYRIINGNGKEKILLNRNEFIRDITGSPIKLTGTIQDVTEQRIAEKLDARKRKVEALATSISTELINLPGQEIGDAVNATLQKLGGFYSMQRVFLLLYNYEQNTSKVAFEYIDPNVKNRVSILGKLAPLEINHPILSRIFAGELLLLGRMDKLVSEEKTLSDFMDQNHSKTLITFPLGLGGEILGNITLLSELEKSDLMQEFGDFERAYLRAIGEMLSNALERKRREEELRIERDLLAGIMATSVTAITVLNPLGEIMYANPAAEEVLGVRIHDLRKRVYNSPEWKATSIDGGPWLPEDQPFTRVLASGKPVFDVRHAIEDDRGTRKLLSINGSPIKNSQGEISSLVFSVMDITNSLLSEKALKESEDRYRRVAEQTGQMVYDYNIKTGKYTWAGAVEKLTGYSLNEFQAMSAQTLENYIHPDDREHVEQSWNAALNTRSQFIVEYRFLKKENSYMLVEDSGIFLFDSSGEAYRMLGAMADITERRKAQKDLIDSEERLRLALTAAKMGTWSWKIDSGEVFWSENTAAIFGLKPHEFGGTFEEYLDLLHPEDLERVRLTIKDTIEGKSDDYNVEHRIFHSDGSIHWLEGKGRVYRDASGEAVRMAGTVTDVTDRKVAEEALRASELRFQTFYKFANEAIIFIDPRTQRILDTNPAFLHTFGYSAKEIHGVYAENLFTHDSWATVYARVRAYETADNIEIHAVRNSGKEFPAICSIHFYREKDAFIAAISLLDTSALQEAEELRVINSEISIRNRLIELQKSELEEALENLKRTQAQLIQSEKMAALGQLIAGIAHEINNPIGAVQASNQNLQECLLRFQTLLPEVQRTLSSMPPSQVDSFRLFLREARQSKEQLAGIEQRNAKKELTKSLEALGITSAYAFADTLTDMGFQSLNENISFFLLEKNAQVLLEYASIESFFFKNTRTIQIAVDRVSKILYALKNFSHFDTSSSKILTSISENIETVLTIYQNQLKKGIEVVKEYGELPRIYCYPDDLLHVWTNLIYNSLQAMDFRGKILIRTFVQGDYVIVEVNDNGPGIPKEIKDKIFQPFFTTKRPGEGSGLGLDIVKKIVEKHSGKIEVDTSPGSTTFRVSIPIATTPE